MDNLQTIITVLITSGVVSAGVSWFLKSRDRDEQRRWELKREACLEALNIIDSRFADYDWTDKEGKPLKIELQKVIPTGQIRSCFNRLVLACDGPEVPESFEKCLNLDLGDGKAPVVNMDTVVDLRNAIRKELGFGRPLKTRVSWITYITWKDRN